MSAACRECHVARFSLPPSHASRVLPRFGRDIRHDIKQASEGNPGPALNPSSRKLFDGRPNARQTPSELRLSAVAECIPGEKPRLAGYRANLCYDPANP